MIVYPWTVVESVHGRIIVNRNCDFQIDALAKTGRTHIEPEIEAIRSIAATLPDRCIAIDGGCNIGLVSIPLATIIRSRGGIVLAFDIQIAMTKALAGSALLNGLDNLSVNPAGLGAERGMMRVPIIDYTAPQDFGMVRLTNGTKDGMPVQVLRIDDLGLHRLDFLKLDIEGSEAAALKGAEATIAEHRPWAWIEYFMSDPAAIKAAFHGLDYRFYRMDDQNMLCAPEDRFTASGLKIDAPEM